MLRAPKLAFAVAATVTLTACNGSDEPGPPPVVTLAPTPTTAQSTTTPSTTTPATTTPGTSDPSVPGSTPDSSIPVTSVPVVEPELITELSDAAEGIVRISTDGTYALPDPVDYPGMNVTVGAGAGFFVDNIGTVVTSTTAVLGAERIYVHIHGEAEPQVAELYGYDLCSGVALLKYEGPYPGYFTWDTDELRNGDALAVTSISPNGAATATRATVLSNTSQGGTWSSGAPLTIRTDAASATGGGAPVLSDHARVRGMSLSDIPDGIEGGAALSSAASLLAINNILAGTTQPLDVNAVEVVAEDGYGGLWVTAVQPGSRSERAGIRAGDVITSVKMSPTGGTTRLTLPDSGFSSLCRNWVKAGQPANFELETWRHSSRAAGSGTNTALNTSAQAAVEPGIDLHFTGTAVHPHYLDKLGLVGFPTPLSWTKRRDTPQVVNGQPAAALTVSYDRELFEANVRTARGASVTVSGGFGAAYGTPLVWIDQAADTVSWLAECPTVAETDGAAWDLPGQDVVVRAYSGCPDGQTRVIGSGYLDGQHAGSANTGGYLFEVQVVTRAEHQNLDRLISGIKPELWPS